MLKTFFTEVLQKEDWLKLMDHLFVFKEDPELLVYFLCAFLLCSKGHIQQLTSIDELHSFLSKETGVSFKKIMAMAFVLHNKYKHDIITGNNITSYLPLQKEGQTEYPLFNRYPEHIISHQARIREKIY